MPNLYPTPHINSSPEDFAPTVLMPGDPLRSEFIAKNFLSDCVLINDVRGVKGYTGFYNGCRVSVMASGMGMPSIGIYSYELFNFFGVENIIRVGSAGSINKNVRVRDIVLGMGACTDSDYAKNFNLPGTFAPVCSYEMLKICSQKAEDDKLNYHVGNLLSTDVFYADSEEKNAVCWNKMGVLAVEMESAALYMNAARSGKNALAICTVSDSLVTGDSLSSDERQTTFTQMMELALKTAASLPEKSNNRREKTK